jgi:uncharacterized protein (DUF433 family)/predicted nuclease of predicted toxin-antitoxin system
MNPLLSRISIDPNVCFGKPCVRGTRIWVSLLLDFLASGTTMEQILDEYPQLTRDDILAAIAYGAEMSRGRFVDLPWPERGMKFKLDENLGSRTAGLIAEAGHEVETVAQEKLSGTNDARLLEICIAEQRCLISSDLDFADVLRFPPYNTPGIAVLRLPRVASLNLLTGFVRSLLAALQTASIAGRLWVVEAGRIRVYEETG